MNTKLKKKFITIVSIIVAIITLIIGVKLLTLNKKATEIFGNIQCDGHQLLPAGFAFTSWSCKLCGNSYINSNTAVPAICNTCATLTGRCQESTKNRHLNNVPVLLF